MRRLQAKGSVIVKDDPNAVKRKRSNGDDIANRVERNLSTPKGTDVHLRLLWLTVCSSLRHLFFYISICSNRWKFNWWRGGASSEKEAGTAGVHPIGGVSAYPQRQVLELVDDGRGVYLGWTAAPVCFDKNVNALIWCHNGWAELVAQQAFSMIWLYLLWMLQCFPPHLWYEMIVQIMPWWKFLGCLTKCYTSRSRNGPCRSILSHWCKKRRWRRRWRASGRWSVGPSPAKP